MNTPSWIRQCFARKSPARLTGRRTRPSKARPRCRLCLEILEDRLAPAVLTVDTLADSSTNINQLTLREAVTLVNSGGDPAALGQSSMPAGWASQISGSFGSSNAIQFASSLAMQNDGYGYGTIALNSIGDSSVGPSALAVDPGVSLTVTGLSGSSGITIERAPGAPAMRLFLVASSGNSTGSLTLENLTLSGGDAVGGNGGGGSSRGGGSGGGAAGVGGAVFVEQGASLRILDSTLTGNTAQGGNAPNVLSPDEYGEGGGGGGLNTSGGTPLGNNGGGPNGGIGAVPGVSRAVPKPAGFGGGGGGGGNYDANPPPLISAVYGEPGGDAGQFGGGGGGGGGFQIGGNYHAVGGGNGGSGGWGGGGGGGGHALESSYSGNLGLGGGPISNGRYGFGGYGGGNGGNGNGYSSGIGGGGAGMGGAVYNDRGNVTITDSTLTENSAIGGLSGLPAGGPMVPLGQNGSGLGGVVFNDNGLLSVYNSTLDANNADKGGAVFTIAHDGGTAFDFLGDSILAGTNKGNTDFYGVNISGGQTYYSAAAANLIQNNNGFAPSAGSPKVITGVDPNLGPLQNNGGPTLTMAPLASSPVRNQGAFLPYASTDQRGLPREYNNGIDLGALELNSAILTVNTVNGNNTDPSSLSLLQAVELADGALTRADLSTVQNSLVQGDPVSGVATIEFAAGLAGQTINLTSSMDNARGPTALLVTNNLTINGQTGPNSGVTLAGPGNAGNLRLFRVSTGASLMLENLTLSGGNAVTSTTSDTNSLGGGAIFNQGQLTLVNSTLSGDSTHGTSNGFGGTAASGGAILNYDGGTANIIQSTFYNDNAYGGNGGNGQLAGQGVGGAIYNDLGTVNITNSTLAHNGAEVGSDVYNYAVGRGGLTLNNSILTESTTTATDYWQVPGSSFSGGDNLISSFANIQPAGTFASGQSGQAFSFSGSDAYVRLPLAPFGTADFSMSFSIRTAAPNAQELLGNRVDASGGNFFSLRMNSSGQLVAELDQDASGTNYVAAISPQAINDGVFHQVVIVRSGTTLSLYVDGALAASASSEAVTDIDNTNPFLLGAQPGNVLSSFNGLLENVAVYNQALTAEEVQSLPSTTPPGLVDLYTGNGNAQDSGPGKLNGTLVNFTLSSNPLLSTLTNHGGPTATLEPLAASPVLNAGDPSFVASIAQAEGVATSAATDQNGKARLFGTTIDLGSVEAFRLTSTPPPPASAYGLDFLPLAATTTAGRGPGTIQVEVLNYNTNQILSSDNSDQVTLSGAPFTAGNSLTAMVHNGIATFNNVVIDQPGSYTLTTTSGHFKPGQDQLTVVAAPTTTAATPTAPASAPPLVVPPLLEVLDLLLGGKETVNTDRSVTMTDNWFGLPLLVSDFSSSGSLESVDWLGINVTLLFDLL